MKKNKYIGIMMMAAGMLAATSCSDFSDYNEVAADATPAANLTLWENIQQHEELSDFAALVQKAGFADALNETQSYTIWAPKNGTFNRSDYEGLSDKALLRQFVKNHIASYPHRASGAMEERVLMLNEKSYVFKGEGPSTYEFDGVNVAQANVPSTNGVMHILDGDAKFYPNLYEFLTDKVLGKEKEIDKLKEFFVKYEETKLNEQLSVPGPIVDGMQTWVDSVMDTSNSLWRTLGAKTNVEDSTWTFVMPNNTAWDNGYEKIKAYFNYSATTVAQAFKDRKSLEEKNAEININRIERQDSLTKYFLTRYLIFSNNDGYNKWMTGGPSYTTPDSLRTTRSSQNSGINLKLSDPQNIVVDPVVEKIPMSNGQALIVNNLGMHSWDTYAPKKELKAASNIGMIQNGSPRTFHVTSYSPQQPDFSYVYVEALGTERPEMTITLPDVLSTEYDIYCVFSPALDKTGNTDFALLPNRVVFTINYCDDKGNLKEQVMLDESEENVNSFKEKFPTFKDNKTNYNTIRGFSNDPAKLDTVYVGRFKFPICYYGLGSAYRPNIKISTPFRATNQIVGPYFTRDLRIAGIVLKPKELVDYEESNQQ